MDAQTRRVLISLGFTAALHAEHCHGYQCGCHCSDCTDQSRLIREHRDAGRHPFTKSGAVRKKPAPHVPQPWDPRHRGEMLHPADRASVSEWGPMGLDEAA